MSIYEKELLWSFSIAENLFKNSIDFKDVVKKDLFVYLKNFVSYSVNLNWIRFLNEADDYFDEEKNLKLSRLQTWKEKFSEYKYNSTLEKIAENEIFMIQSESKKEIIQKRIETFQLALSLILDSNKYNVQSDYFRAMCTVAMIIDDATDILDDFKKENKTIFTIYSPDQSRKECFKLLYECYNSLEEEPNSTEFVTLNLATKSLLHEHENISLSKVFWLLAIYKLNNLSTDTKLPFCLSTFLRSL